MHSVEIAAQAATEMSNALTKISFDQVDSLLSAIVKAKKIYVAGCGRSLLMLRGIAMRLMHIGFAAHVVGDITTPAFEAGDLLIVGSGSGETGSLVGVAEKAKKLGGTLAVITIFSDSTLARIADVVVRIPAYTDKLPQSGQNKRSILPGGSMFEQAMLVLGDSIILPLAEKNGVPTDRMFSRHANLE